LTSLFIKFCLNDRQLNRISMHLLPYSLSSIVFMACNLIAFLHPMCSFSSYYAPAAIKNTKQGADSLDYYKRKMQRKTNCQVEKISMIHCKYWCR